MFRSLREREENPENAAEVALRRGLRQLPVPDTTSDFDARIHAALRLPTPWWRTLWTHARPVLSAAACSLLVTLALLKGLATTAGTLQSLAKPAGTTAVVAYGARNRMDALDSANDLSAASLRGFATLR